MWTKGRTSSCSSQQQKQQLKYIHIFSYVNFFMKDLLLLTLSESVKTSDCWMFGQFEKLTKL